MRHGLRSCDTLMKIHLILYHDLGNPTPPPLLTFSSSFPSSSLLFLWLLLLLPHFPSSFLWCSGKVSHGEIQMSPFRLLLTPKMEGTQSVLYRSKSWQERCPRILRNTWSFLKGSDVRRMCLEASERRPHQKQGEHCLLVRKWRESWCEWGTCKERSYPREHCKLWKYRIRSSPPPEVPLHRKFLSTGTSSTSPFPPWRKTGWVV